MEKASQMPLHLCSKLMEHPWASLGILFKFHPLIFQSLRILVRPVRVPNNLLEGWRQVTKFESGGR